MFEGVPFYLHKINLPKLSYPLRFCALDNTNRQVTNGKQR